ncbi:MAG: hypothetical protein AAB834_02805 [Patescibacteria group bacterium]
MNARKGYKAVGKRQPAVAILYGAGEGRLSSKKMRACLQQAGFAVTTDLNRADIVIAHSGGMFYVPRATRAKAVLLVGPVVCYEGSAAATLLRKVAIDLKSHAAQGQLPSWLRKSFLNTYYLLTQPHRVVFMWTKARQYRETLPPVASDRVGVIVLKDDPCSKLLPNHDLRRALPYSFMHYDRLHDDLWINPEDYVGVLQYLYEP